MDYLKENNLLEDNQLAEENKQQLLSIAQWLNIYAILSFISLGISLLSTILAYSRVSDFGGSAAVGAALSGGLFTLLIGGGITLLLSITIFNAAKFIKAGIVETNQGAFILGITKLATFFKINGIIIIVIGVILAIGVVIAILAAILGGFR